jgi:hypothetical protein
MTRAQEYRYLAERVRDRARQADINLRLSGNNWPGVIYCSLNKLNGTSKPIFLTIRDTAQAPLGNCQCSKKALRGTGIQSCRSQSSRSLQISRQSSQQGT